MLALALRQASHTAPMEKASKDFKLPRWHDFAIREATQNRRGPFYVAAPIKTKLDDIATKAIHLAPEDLARLGFAVAHAIDSGAPAPEAMSEELRTVTNEIAEVLRNAERPLIVTGSSPGSEALIHAAANAAWSLCNENRTAMLSCIVPECNTMGLALFEAPPLEEAMKADAETVVVLENDLYRRAEAEPVDGFLSRVKNLIVIDHGGNATTEKAGLLLPGGSFAESDGTFVNNEGRAQRFYQVHAAKGDIEESWRWVQDAFNEHRWNNLDEITAALAAEIPVFGAIPEIAPPGNYRVNGLKIPRQPARYSGRTAMNAHVHVSEGKPPEDPDSPLAYSMEGHRGLPPAPLTPFYWSAGWNSVQSLNKFQSEIGGHLHGGDPGRRLIEPLQGTAKYFTGIPSAFTKREGEWVVFPTHHIFGDEELSARAPGLAQRIPEPYIVISPEDAHALGVAASDMMRVRIGETALNLTVRILDSVAPGTAGMPVHLPTLPTLSLPAWAQLGKEAERG